MTMFYSKNECIPDPWRLTSDKIWNAVHVDNHSEVAAPQTQSNDNSYLVKSE